MPSSLIDLLGELVPPIRIVDVGALWLSEESHIYRPLLRTDKASVIGFEPIPEECEALNRRFGHPHRRFLPCAIGDGSKHPFYRCNFPMTSSLLEPDLNLMDQFHDLSCYCQIASVEEIETHRLDDLKDISPIDYLKIDVQGSELDVLKGAARTLRDTLVVQAEVEFLPIYKNQPLFAEIDEFLRRHGLMFHSFTGMETRALESFKGTGASSGNRQLLWADAVYIRPMLTWIDLPVESLLKLALILHEVYRAFDFSAKLLRMVDDRSGTAYCPQYLHMIQADSDP